MACERSLSTLSLLLVIKGDCQACDELLAVGPGIFEGFDVYYLTADDAPAFDAHGQEVLRSTSALAALEVRWPPVYVVVDPARAEVVAEGVVFDAAQIRAEIEPLLT